jgi:alpha-L-fucosidase
MGKDILTLLVFGMLTAASSPALAAEERAVPAVDDESLAAWQAMRFGMFIHWGPVSLKGTEIGWSRGSQVPREEYDQLCKRFNPVGFDAREWVRMAKDAGMRYIVITSKHHDGFCIWDSAYTDYDMMATPFKRDILAELSEACKEAGIAFSTYHSILDWYQPDYNTIDAQGGPGYALPAGQEPSMDRYQTYMQNQLREIVEKYGPLQSMWFDGEWEEPWTMERGWQLLRFCRELDPKMLVNNRVGKGRQGMEGTTKTGFAPGDYDTPEQQVGAFNDERPWETCMTICQQWAWKPDDRMKSLEECVRTLVMTAGGDGNLLFNVGPMPDGRIEPRQVERLREMGAWLEKNGESVYGTRGGPFRPEKWGCSTHRDNTVYVHVFEWESGRVRLPGLGRKVQSAALLNGDSVEYRQESDHIELWVKKERRDPIDTVVELSLAE